jgi:hypothetical protein
VRFSKEKEKNPTDSTKVIYKIFNTLNLNMSLSLGKLENNNFELFIYTNF